MNKEQHDYTKGVETLIKLVGEIQAEAIIARFKHLVMDGFASPFNGTRTRASFILRSIRIFS